MRRVLLLLLVGCGASQTAPSAPAAPATTGTVDTETYAQVGAFFARKRAIVEQCYDNAFAQVEPGKRPSGHVTLALDVLPSGKPEGVRVSESTLKSEPVERCLTGMVSRWVLPQPAERMTFSYSYDFKPE